MKKHIDWKRVGWAFYPFYLVGIWLALYQINYPDSNCWGTTYTQDAFITTILTLIIAILTLYWREILIGILKTPFYLINLFHHNGEDKKE